MMAVVSTEVDFVVVNSTAVDFMIATSGDVSEPAPASTHTTTMMTTLTTIRMAIIRMPPAIHTLTTAVVMWFSDACTLRMAGACNPVRCAVDRLSWIDVDRDLERSPDRLSFGGREMTSA
jgi:hypothetical protein